MQNQEFVSRPGGFCFFSPLFLSLPSLLSLAARSKCPSAGCGRPPHAPTPAQGWEEAGRCRRRVRARGPPEGRAAGEGVTWLLGCFAVGWDLKDSVSGSQTRLGGARSPHRWEPEPEPGPGGEQRRRQRRWGWGRAPARTRLDGAAPTRGSDAGPSPGQPPLNATRGGAEPGVGPGCSAPSGRRHGAAGRALLPRAAWLAALRLLLRRGAGRRLQRVVSAGRAGPGARGWGSQPPASALCCAARLGPAPPGGHRAPPPLQSCSLAARLRSAGARPAAGEGAEGTQVAPASSPLAQPERCKGTRV